MADSAERLYVTELTRHWLPVALTLALLSGCTTAPTLSTQETRLTRLAQDLSRRGDVASAVTLYERAAAAMPDNPDIQLALGQVQLRNGNPQAASQAFRKVYQLRPEDPEAVLGLGYAALLEHNTERAQALIATAAPQINTYSAYNLLGISATLNGEFEQAHQALKTAESLAPGNLEIKANQAMVYALSNNMPAAIEQIAAVTTSPLAEPHHFRRQALILVLARQEKQAEKALQGMPAPARQALIARAKRIRAIADPIQRASAIGIIPTYAPAPTAPLPNS